MATGEQSLEFKQSLSRSKTSLLKLLEYLCLEEILVPELYQYHKLVIVYQGLRVHCVVLVPYSYPSMYLLCNLGLPGSRFLGLTERANPR